VSAHRRHSGVGAPCTRRALLGLVSVAPAAALAACRPAATPAPAETSIALERLPEGERVVVMHGEEPVELVRDGAAVRARSLWCTHTGCRVNWDANATVYRCVCHEATFAADGRVLTGPPPRPLREIAVHVEAGHVIFVDPPFGSG
jgi:nitrite reductase/ring-hydroxylating ferredoxin subunit